MDTSSPQQSAVNPLRLAKLFGIVVGSITLLAVIALISVAEWPLVRALLWHMRNGDTVVLEGHSFHVPFLFEPEVTKGGKQVDIIEYPRLLPGVASVTVESSPKAFDSESIDRWQALLIDAANKRPNNLIRSIPVTLHGKKLTFVCVDLVFSGEESLLCHSAGTSLTVSTTASPTHIRETRGVLETSD
jgi:hypothetical protein